MKQPVPAPRQQPPQASLRVRFYRRMKPQRVYPLAVEVGGAGAVPLGQQPVTLRPIVPGALVVPADHRAEALRPGERYTFFVTPLARGRLPEPRLEVVQPGRPAQPIPLRMKGVTQRLTWLLLALTILVPLGIVYITRIAPLQGLVPRVINIPDIPQANKAAAAAAGGEQAAERPGDQAKDTPKPGGGDGDAAKPGEKDKDAARPGDKPKDTPKPEKAGPAGKQDQAAPGAGGEKQPGPGRPGGRAGGPPGGMPRMGGLPMPGMPGTAPPPPPDAQAAAGSAAAPGNQREILVKERPGAVLTYRLDSALNEGLPAASDILTNESAAKAVRGAWDATVPHATWRLGWVYELLCNAPTAWFWIGLLLLGLTTISWLTHGPRRASRRAVLLLAPAAHGAGPLGSAEPRPVTVEPA
jgi:hypothetical protein